MTVGQTLKRATDTLETVGISSSRLDTLILLEQAAGLSREYLLANPDFQLKKTTVTNFESLISKRAQRIPLVHIIGKLEFYGLDFTITPDALSPRAETEQMVEWAIQYAPNNSRLIDIGTGSGAIALSIAHHRPDLEITATEVSFPALKLAKRNAVKLNLNTRFVQSDLFESISGRFSTVVTNLPYLKNNDELIPEVQKEPSVALFGGKDGLDIYRRFLAQLPDHLEPNGYLFTECDPWQQPKLIIEAARVNLLPLEQGYFIMGFQLK